MMKMMNATLPRQQPTPEHLDSRHRHTNRQSWLGQDLQQYFFADIKFTHRLYCTENAIAYASIELRISITDFQLNI